VYFRRVKKNNEQVGLEVILWAHIGEVLVSNPDPDTDHPG
jgi:hypothetical protein